MRIAVVGAGISGLTAARLLADAGHSVEVFETRNHIGGNCHDEYHLGCIVHKYGAHIFHTDKPFVMKFIDRFATLNCYKHKVMVETDIGLMQFPIRHVDHDIATQLLPYFTEKYSQKQWGIPFSELPPIVKKRVSMRTADGNQDYFLDPYQGIPVHGYSAMFKKMSDGLKIHLGCDKDDWKKATVDHTIYTGKLDEYFDCMAGTLEYRSLSFVDNVTSERLPCAVVNDSTPSPHTRTIDHSFWNGSTTILTVHTRETPCEHDGKNIPYYPKPFGKNIDLANKYLRSAGSEENVTFLGRLARYEYLNMDEAVAQAMAAVGKLIERSE